MNKNWRDRQRKAEQGAFPEKTQARPGFRQRPGLLTHNAKPKRDISATEVQLNQVYSSLWYPGAGGLYPLGVNFAGLERAPAPPPIDLEKLAKLQTIEPRKVAPRIPDYVQAITGWRAWSVKGGKLSGIGVGGVWEPKQPTVASCTPNSMFWGELRRDNHAAPQSACNCGVWSFKTLEILTAALALYSDIKILGKVSLWGKVVECENGWRAQFAYPEELWLFDNSLEYLGRLYDVPVRML